MEAVFIVNSNEFDESLFNKIQSIVNSKKNLEIIISINEESKGVLRQETREEYFARLDKAISNLDKGEEAHFTTEEFEDFSMHLLNEP